MATFSDEVREFMQRWDYAPSEMGRAAMKDPNFFLQILRGERSPTERVMIRLREWMRGGEEKHSVLARAWLRDEENHSVLAHGVQRIGRRYVWPQDKDRDLIWRRVQGATWKELGTVFRIAPATIAKHYSSLRRDEATAEWAAAEAAGAEAAVKAAAAEEAEREARRTARIERTARRVGRSAKREERRAKPTKADAASLSR